MANKPNVIYLVVGKSGSGKTTFVDTLAEILDWDVIQSYTTRAPRTPNEKGHIFIAKDFYKDFDDLKTIYPNRVAETVFNGHFYFCTAEQVDECQLYVIDPKGIEYFWERYKGSKKVVVIYLKTNMFQNFYRMLRRGDKIWEAIRRIRHDSKEFIKAGKMADIVLKANDRIITSWSGVYLNTRNGIYTLYNETE